MHLVLPACACVCIEWAVSPKEGLRCCHAMTPPICCCPVKRSWRQRSGHPRRGTATQSASCLPASQCCGIGPALCTHTHTQTHACPHFGSLCGADQCLGLGARMQGETCTWGDWLCANSAFSNRLSSPPANRSSSMLPPVGRPFILTDVACRHQLPIRECNIHPILLVCEWEILEWSEPTNLIYKAGINKEIVPSLIALLNNGCVFGNHFSISHHFPAD